jgi:hypothetical protein
MGDVVLLYRAVGNIMDGDISLFENEGRSQQPKSIEHESAAARERGCVCVCVCV